MKRIVRIQVLLIAILVSCNQKNTEPFSNIWSFQYEQSAEALSIAALPPMVTDDGILLAPDKQVTLLDSQKGTKQWSFAYPSGQWIGNNSFLSDNNNLFLSEHRGNDLFSISIKNGSVNWNTQLQAGGKEFFEDSNDGIDENFIYITGRYGEIFRFTQTGDFDRTYNILEYEISDRARSIHLLNNQLIFSQVFRKDELSHDSGRILSIDKETEEVIWEYLTDNGGFIFEPILLEDEIIYAGVTDGPGEFVALNANDGEVIWKTLGVIGQSYTLTDSMVLVNDGISLLALDKFTGKELWNTGLAFGGGDGGDNIGYLNGYVYHAHSGRLYILEGNTGEIVHVEERSPDGSPFQLLAVSEDRIFIQTFNALYAYTAWE